PACQPLLQWDMRYTNHAGAFEPSSQYTALNIRDQDGTILATPFKTQPGDPLVLPAMTAFQVDLTAFSGQTVQIDFEHQVFNFFFDAQWDHIRVICKGLGATPGTLDFGVIGIGESATRTTTVTNFAQIPITIGAAQTSAGFAVAAGPALPLTLPPGESTAFDVRFDAVANGPVTGILTLDSDDPNGATVVALSGLGAAPVLVIEPTESLDFGPQRVGTPSFVQFVTARNAGLGSLTIVGAAVFGPFQHTGVPVPITLGPEQSATFEVVFVPSFAGPAAGQFQITTTAGPASIALSGFGLEPVLAVDRTALAFANTRTGATSAAKLVQISNTGNTSLQIASIAVAAPFIAIAPPSAFEIGPNGSVAIEVRFAPTAAGPASTDLVITTDAGTAIVACTGTGTEPAISAGPPAIAFGNVRAGTTSPGKTIVVKNTGTAALTIAAATAPAAFTVAAALPVSVLPGGSLALTVKFAPTATGATAGTVVISSDAGPAAIAVSGTGVAPAIATPTAHDFGNVRTGTTSAPATIAIANPGTDTLTITSITIAAPFARAAVTLPAAIAPGGSLAVAVTFAPATSVVATGSLSITSDAGPASVALTGRGVAPLIAASVSPVDFGTVAIGDSAALAVELENHGDAPLAISTVAITGTGAGDYSLSGASFPAVVPAGGAVALTVTFAPHDHGARAAQLAVTSDASALAVALVGSGSGPRIALAPPALAFGATNVGVIAAPKTVAVTNTGETDLVVSAIVLGGANAADFAVATALPVTLAPGDATDVELTFTPSAIGARSATATAITTDPLAPTAAITLAGTGESPALAVTPAIAFGDVRVGTTKALALAIKNTGTGPLSITSIALAGPDAAQLSLSAVTLPLVLAPNASRTVTVTFAPTVLGSANATVSVLSDDAANAAVAVPLTGAGVSPTIAITPSDVDFGGQLVGRLAAPRQVHIRNIGSGPLVVQTVALTGAAAAAFSLVAPPQLPATIAAAGELVVTVRVAPAVAGAVAANLSITTDSPDAPTATAGLVALGISTALSASPSAIDFGPTHVPAGGEPVAVTLVNLTGDTLSLTDAVLGGARPGDFTVTAVAGSFAPGATITALVSYAATTPATSAATLTFRTTDPAIPTSVVALAGHAVSTFITADRDTLEFGEIQVGDRSGPKSITVTNVTATPVTVASVACADPQFVVDAAAALVTIPPSGHATFTVAFEPTTGAPATSQVLVTLADGSSSGELSIAVTGEGTGAPDAGCQATRGSGSVMAFLVLALAVAIRKRRR
ncbi:MAG: choice-of-anchor D domain-containing protein, partial [Kofleriaceae bacterium]